LQQKVLLLLYIFKIFPVLKNVFWGVLLCFVTFLNLYGENNSGSVLSSGEWYKIHITRDGIYQITYAELRNLGLSNPADVRIYGSEGAMLPETVDARFSDDLKEVPILMVTKNNGVFTDGDYILFYGQGPVVWKYNHDQQAFEHELHLWDNQSCYFITSQPGGKRIRKEESSSLPANYQVTSFDEHLFHEQELNNVINSGRFWYGEYFRSPLNHYFSFSVPDIDLNQPVSVNIDFLARSSSRSYLEVRHNNQQITNQALPVYGQEYAVASSFTASLQPASGQVSIELILNQNGNSLAEGWLNFLRLHVRRKLNLSQPPLFFRDIRSVEENRVSEFSITGSNSNTVVWDVTDMHDIREMNTSLSGNTLSFVTATGHLREFVAFNLTDGLMKPSFSGQNHIENQNLHAIDADMVIVSHPDFISASEELANLHRENDGLSVHVATTEQVYHEFSSGKQDPAAIRNFMKTVYEKSGKLKYLLLMGDGSFDNKSNQIKNGRATSNTNYVVTYQSVESAHTIRSYVSDDYFGILGDGEDILGGSLKIGIGRLPVQTSEEAQDAVNKIRKYMEHEISSDWPNIMGLLADDDDGNIHMSQSDSIAVYVTDYEPQYTIEKLYFDAFQQIPTADGHRYPEVTERLESLLNKSCFLINYIGHGNATGLSEERVVNSTSIDQWKNKIYPLFVVATCEFGRYDDQRTTAGEKLILNPNGGGIALLTSTRLVYSSQNFQFNKSFFRALFSEPFDENPYRLGDLIRLSKNASGTSINKLCFTLLGDPALKLPVPSNNIRTVSINGKAVDEPLDTLKANNKITIKAEVINKNGQRLDSFNGIVHISLFDKPREKYTLNNDGNTQPMKFETQTSLLYKGKATVRYGEFEASFIIPRDINYQFGHGKISYFAYSESDIASGAFNQITIGGSGDPIDDTSGPEIRLFMNDTLFRNGGITDQNPVLIALLKDESGINTSGEGIGHDITAVLSHDPSKIYTLNPYYEAELDDYRKGMVVYHFSDLPVGEYELIFNAWDVVNNASQASIRFRVTRSGVLHISNLYNYPNPFSDFTYIYFEHNFPEEAVEVEMQVFDINGKRLSTTKQSLFSEGYTSGQLRWNGYDANGNRMNSGIYPYRIILRTKTGQEVLKSSKIVLIRQ
jgi:hypothetical protein